VIAAIVPNPKDVQTVIQALHSTAVPAPLTTRRGVSGTHSDPDQLGSAHAEARGALHVAGRLGNGQPGAVFDELRLLRFLIGPRDETDLEQFVHQVIGPRSSQTWRVRSRQDASRPPRCKLLTS
jgi:hypothetical protein